MVKHEYSIFNNLRISTSKDWIIAAEQCPKLRHFNPYEECTGFVPACNYLIKHKEMTQIPAFTLYDTFGLDKNTIERLAKIIGKKIYIFKNIFIVVYVDTYWWLHRTPSFLQLLFYYTFKHQNSPIMIL